VDQASSVTAMVKGAGNRRKADRRVVAASTCDLPGFVSGNTAQAYSG
jgi:hypothetical protein